MADQENETVPTELDIIAIKIEKLKASTTAQIEEFARDLEAARKEQNEFIKANQEFHAENRQLKLQLADAEKEIKRLRSGKDGLLAEFAETIDRLTKRRRLFLDSPDSPSREEPPQEEW